MRLVLGNTAMNKGTEQKSLLPWDRYGAAVYSEPAGSFILRCTPRTP